MGQHKYNSTAIAAANAELPPKPKKLGKLKKRKTTKANDLCRDVYQNWYSTIF